MAERKLVVVRSPFFAGSRMVGIGEVWGAEDRIVKSYPNAFRPLEIKSSEEVAPVTRPARKTTTRRASTAKSKPKATTKK